MSIGRRVLFVVSFIIIDLLLICSIFLLKDYSGKIILKNEINSLAELDFTKDNYNKKIKTNGDYAIVESAIKDSLNSYATDIQDLLSVRYDEKLNKLLTLNNYVEDGPLFEISLRYISSLRSDFNYRVDMLLDVSNEELIYDYIYNYVVDDESVKLYNNLLLDSRLVDKVEESRTMLGRKRIEFNSYFDSIYNVLSYLRENCSYYSIINDKIVFSNTNIEEEYYKLLNEVKRIYE